MKHGIYASFYYYICKRYIGKNKKYMTFVSNIFYPSYKIILVHNDEEYNFFCNKLKTYDFYSDKGIVIVFDDNNNTIKLPILFN